MAFDENLAARLRKQLAAHPGVVEFRASMCAYRRPLRISLQG